MPRIVICVVCRLGVEADRKFSPAYEVLSDPTDFVCRKRVISFSFGKGVTLLLIHASDTVPMPLSLTAPPTLIARPPPCGRKIALSYLISRSFFCLKTTKKHGDVYSTLWAAVFGFATLNILGLVARRFLNLSRNRLNFGETVAIWWLWFRSSSWDGKCSIYSRSSPIKLHPHD